MNEYYKIYLPKLKREMKLEISIPRNYEGITFETVYFLDGQNAFKDSHSAFGRSIRATKPLGIIAKEINKRILGVALFNAESDQGRTEEYSPFPVENPNDPYYKKDKTHICMNFCYDFIHTIIPFIEAKYNVYKEKEHRFIYGSSLGANMAAYLTFNYDLFGGVGLFSSATFISDNAFDKFLLDNVKKDVRVFLYVGKKESSDSIFDSKLYYNTSLKLYNTFKNHGNPVRFIVSENGIHNEECWGNHILEFLSFMFTDIVYKS